MGTLTRKMALYGYPYGAVAPVAPAPVFDGSSRLSAELQQEEAFITQRRQLHESLRQSAAAEAKAVFDRATAAFQKAQEVCKAETAAAQKTAEDARAQAAQTEQGTASHLSSLQASAMPPVYN